MKPIAAILALSTLLAAAGLHAAQDAAACRKGDKTIKADDRTTCEKQGGKWKAAAKKSKAAMPDEPLDKAAIPPDPLDKQAMPPDPLGKKAAPPGAAGQRAMPDDPFGKKAVPGAAGQRAMPDEPLDKPVASPQQAAPATAR